MTEKEIHIWTAFMELHSSKVQSLYRLLSVDELERASKFVSIQDEMHFMHGRIFLRIVLARYMHVNPASINFSYNRFGKPSVESPGYSFSLSKSSGYLLLSISILDKIGSDIERVHEFEGMDSIASSAFSCAEWRSFKKLQGIDRVNRFFEYWTKKESVIKAEGKGLGAIPLRSFDVSGNYVRPDLENIEAYPLDHPYVVANFSPCPGITAAIAFRASAKGFPELLHFRHSWDKYDPNEILFESYQRRSDKNSSIKDRHCKGTE